jgi:hypothetical protein
LKNNTLKAKGEMLKFEEKLAEQPIESGRGRFVRSLKGKKRS